MTDDETTTDEDPALEIYAKQYFDASPTWNAWNKLRIKDLHELREESDYRGQNIYFHLNHPIQYAIVVGMAVQIELGGGLSAKKYCFLKLDDGTEHILNIKIMRRQPDQSNQVYPSTTMIDDLDVVDEVGQDIMITVKKRPLMPGAIVRARGTIESYRGVNQMVLDRLKFINNTDDELQHWKKLIEWRHNVLDRPWVLADADRERVDQQIVRDRIAAERHAKHKKRRLEKQARRQGKLHTALEQEETERARLELLYDDGALVGTDRIRMPWT